MPEFILANPVISAALAVIALATIAIWIPWGSIRIPSIGKTTSPELTAIEALKVLDAHYANCPEGKASLKVLKSHFFDHEGQA